MKRRRLPLGIGLLLALSAARVHALTDEEIFRDFRFNLINPGARSMALGGAFVSLADDATAAQANPAGLSFQLGTKRHVDEAQEYFAEYRYVDNGAQSNVRRESLPAGLNTFVATGTELEDTSSPSFLSVVLPVGENWRFGVSRHEVLHQRSDTVSSFAFVSSIGDPGAFLLSGTGFLDVRMTSYAASGGYRLKTKFGEWGLGASVAYSTLRAQSEVRNLVVDTSTSVTGQEILEPRLDLRTSIDDEDSDIGVNIGAIYGSPEAEFRVGLVYRRAPKFSVTETIVPACPEGIDPLTYEPLIEETCGLDIFKVNEELSGGSFANQFNTPDSYSLSVAWKATDRLTFVQDFERTEYSDLTDGFVPGVNVLTGFDAEFTADDALDYRAGAEYVLPLQPLVLALRAGLFTESDSAIRAQSTGSPSFATPVSFPGREGQIHGAGGVGLVFQQGKYVLDFAVDIADTDNEYVFSFIYHNERRKP